MDLNTPHDTAPEHLVADLLARLLEGPTTAASSSGYQARAAG